MERLEKQIQFLLEMDKEKSIKRQTRCTDLHMENDAEHAWHIALACLLLNEYANGKVDVSKTISMLLIHDIVEIDAGDTYAYDEKGQQNAFEKEYLASERLFSLLPEDQGKFLKSLWLEFEENKTMEAKFAHAMDNLLPIILNDADEGTMWKKNHVSVSQILKRQEKTKMGSTILYDYILSIVQQNVDKQNIIKDVEI
ncbi:HD domain-containing protein [Floccifex sp.]|uniref:HD domain-containing protein n=1 Tax=Floccifex sp. TaxID=2815810 RepID=UPI003EFC8DD8